MSYIGNNLQVAYPSYANIDDISGSFDGVTTSFPLTVGGFAPVPAPLSSNQCLISVGGVVQRPDDSGSEGFLLSGGNIVFSAAPTGGDDFFGVILAGADYVNVGVQYPDGTASTPSITFDSDIDTGFYLAGPNVLGLSTNGVGRLVVDSAGVFGFINATRGTINTLTDAATITPNFAAANHFSVTLGGNRTLDNPTNLVAGQSGCIWITQDGTGSRTLAYGSNWDFTDGTAPTLSTAASAVDCLVYAVQSSTKITATLITNLS